MEKYFKGNECGRIHKNTLKLEEVVAEKNWGYFALVKALWLLNIFNDLLNKKNKNHNIRFT